MAESPSESPSASPSLSPSASVSPSVSPSASPSRSPSASPSKSPSASPSLSPSASVSPSVSPSFSPSLSPSASKSPSSSPSASPSASPSESPSPSPTYEDGTSYIPPLIFYGTSVRYGSDGIFHSPTITLTTTSLAGHSSTGTFTLPFNTISSTAYPHSTGTYYIPALILQDLAPYHSIGATFYSPTIDIDAYSRLIPISSEYRGVVMNLLNQAMSTYSGFNFNSMAYSNNRYLGATSTGIYELDEVDDNGTPIHAHAKTGPMDFGEQVVKYIRDVWVTHRTDGKLAIVFSVDEDNSSEVERRTQLVGEELQEEKVKVPRGLKGRYFTMELKNLSGADFDIDSLEIMVDILGGKKR